MAKETLKKLLGRMPKFKKTLSTKKPAQIPADPIEHTFQAAELADINVSSRLDINVDALRTIMAGNSDFVLRQFAIGPEGKLQAAVAYLDGMTDSDMLHKTVLKPLMNNQNTAVNGPDGSVSFDHIVNSLLVAADLRIVEDYKQIMSGLLYGDAVVLVDGHKKALLVSIKGFNTRAVSEPVSEGLVRGPREGFTESLRTNTVLVRRRVQSPNFIIEQMTIGRVANTNVAIGYVRGIVDPKLVEEVKKRLSRIQIDGVLESGYIEELIEDSPLSPFPQVNNTERPDRVAQAVMSGRVAIFTDNTPYVLIVPAEFVSFMQSPEDYYGRYILGCFVRWLRYFALLVSLLLPSLYIAVTTFHQEMIPTPLLVRIAASREGVPFPALVEALLMEVTFELLREAGLRLPRPVGQAVSIVGALVVGEAAVSAGVVSHLMVIIVATTGIASFVNPSFNMAISMRILRFPLMFLAGTLGLFGVMAGLLMILVHMCSLRSFGVPYMAPLAPYHRSGMKDVFIRAPIWALQRRPAELAKANPYRMGPDMKPGPWQNERGKEGEREGNEDSQSNTAWEAEMMDREFSQHEGEQRHEQVDCSGTQSDQQSKTKREGKKRRAHRTHKKK